MSNPAVLVTGVGACGVGEGIAKAVRMAGRYDLIAVNADANAPELFEVDHRYLVPTAHEPEYIETIQRICTEHGVRAVLPGSEPEAKVLAPRKSEFSSAGVALLTNPSSVVDMCQDKWRTFQFLSEKGLPTPRTFRPKVDPDFRGSLGFPMILKPRTGHASQHVFLVRDEAELKTHLEHFDRIHVEPIVQEYIAGDEEYTCSTLIGDNLEILGSIAMRRYLMGGFSQRVVIEDNPIARRNTEEVAKVLGAWGPINVQCRLSDGQYSIFEINARFSGSAPFRAMAGFNEPDIMIQYVLTGLAPPSTVSYGLVGMRRLEEVLVPAEEYRAVGPPPPS